MKKTLNNLTRDDWNWLFPIEFRDFLNAHPTHAKKYEALKTQLAAKFKNNRGTYVLGKTEFIYETLQRIDKNTNLP